MRFITTFSFLALGFAATAYAEDYTITLENNKFTPAEITMTANKKVMLAIVNNGDTTAEFKSKDLDRERTIKPGETTMILLGPVDVGTYTFVDATHPKTAKGTITAVAPPPDDDAPAQ